MIYLTAFMEEFPDNIFIGRIKEFKGLVVQSDSFEGVKKELIKSVRVKLAYDYGLDINQIVKTDKMPPSFIHQSDNSYRLQLV